MQGHDSGHNWNGILRKQKNIPNDYCVIKQIDKYCLIN
jgi:hypothetical protein